jgi:hypothetical protein
LREGIEMRTMTMMKCKKSISENSDKKKSICMKTRRKKKIFHILMKNKNMNNKKRLKSSQSQKSRNNGQMQWHLYLNQRKIKVSSKNQILQRNNRIHNNHKKYSKK